jgi:hypothetical protein
MASDKAADPEQGTVQMMAVSPKACSDDIQDAPSDKKDHDGVVSQDGDKLDKTRDPNRPKGVRFALLYLCILLGSFFIGYVRGNVPGKIRSVGKLTPCSRTQVAWRL